MQNDNIYFSIFNQVLRKAISNILSKLKWNLLFTMSHKCQTVKGFSFQSYYVPIDLPGNGLII